MTKPSWAKFGIKVLEAGHAWTVVIHSLSLSLSIYMGSSSVLVLVRGNQRSKLK